MMMTAVSTLNTVLLSSTDGSAAEILTVLSRDGLRFIYALDDTSNLERVEQQVRKMSAESGLLGYLIAHE